MTTRIRPIDLCCRYSSAQTAMCMRGTCGLAVEEVGREMSSLKQGYALIRATVHAAQVGVGCLVLVRQCGSRRDNGFESMPQNGLRGCCHLGTLDCRSRTSTDVLGRERQQQRQLLPHPFRLTKRLESEIANSFWPSAQIALSLGPKWHCKNSEKLMRSSN